MIRRLICAVTRFHDTKTASIVVHDLDGIQILTLAQCQRCKDFAFNVERVSLLPNGGPTTE